MPTTPFDVICAIEEELDAIKSAVEKIHQNRRSSTQRLQKLVQQRTDAFVDLAEHYLPELSQQSLARAWQEVKREIGDVLLRKRDQRRALRTRIAETHGQIAELTSGRAQAQEELDRAKLVLSCKTGNFKKLLREDPHVQQSVGEIDVLDEEIECYLAHHESVAAESRQKLPAFEQSSLFEYLKEQRFGTPQYIGQGIQRRWDRWVARLIDYRDAKKSYDFLVSTPEHLKQLIDKKQARYRSLLAQLQIARAAAAQRHGTVEQKRDWEAWCQKVADMDERIEEAKWDSIDLLGRLDALEDPHGEYHIEALEIYQRFLQQLDPEVMRVYAQCTDSPIDDEISARLRNVQTKIAEQKAASVEQFKSQALIEKDAATLRELSSRLNEFARATPQELDLGDEFVSHKFLRDVIRLEASADEVWQMMCESMLVPEAKHASNTLSPSRPMLPVEATFAAASDSAKPSPTSFLSDVSSMVLLPEPSDSEKEAFSTMAIVRSRKEAKRIAKLLTDASIPCFVHTHTLGDVENEHEEVDVVVSNERYTEALELLRHFQRSKGLAWTCGSCESQVDAGHRRCWHCGRRRS